MHVERGVEQQTAPTPGTSKIALIADSVCKAYPGVVANQDVTLHLRRGVVHGLLGENGSGKSTLCRIIAGSERADSGRIVVNGIEHDFNSPGDAFAAGIFMVHQHFTLVPTLTVAENVVLGWQRQRQVLYRRRDTEEMVRALGEQYHLIVDPRKYIWQLSVGIQQRVEILKAMYRGAQILVMDEPTAVLTPQEADFLGRSLREFADHGKSVVLVTHRLPEVLAFCDDATVLRSGRVTGRVSVSDGSASAESLTRMMIGRDVTGGQREPEVSTRSEDDSYLLHVEAVVARGDGGHVALNDVTFTATRRAILAIVGVAGNGQHELAEVIVGLRPCAAGAVRLDGASAEPASRDDAVTAPTIGYVPEDRFAVGLIPDLTLAENLSFRNYRSRTGRLGLLSSRRMRAWAEEVIDQYGIRGRPETLVRHLSGGHAQRALLARELASRPDLLVVETPTRGLDVGATAGVHELLRKAAADGAAIVLITEDLDEALAMADNLAVIYHGRVSVLEPDQKRDVETIGRMMAGA